MSDNPFLLPPGGAVGGKHASAPKPPEAAPGVTRSSGDRSRYIAVPADLESGTVKVPPRDAGAPAQLESTAVVEEETRLDPLLAPELEGQRRLVLPDGSTLPIEATLLLGRDPAPFAEFPGAALVPLADPGKTVSKTHAAVTLRGGVVRVRDLHSTNGTAVIVGTRRIPVPPDGDVPVPPGASVELGSFVVRVEPGA